MGKGCYILWPFGLFYGNLGYFMIIWYILCSFGTFFRFDLSNIYQEKSGNPDHGKNVHPSSAWRIKSG
jgi:hypothetical protein